VNKYSWIFARRWPLFWPITLPVLAVSFSALFLLLVHRGGSVTPPWYCAEYMTDNGFHPVHLASRDKSGPCDLMMVRNLSAKPLCVYAFSSRPHDTSQPEEIMTSWARWITVSKQAITVAPGCTWVLKPEDSARLPFIHGNTWLTCFFEPASPGADPDKLPAAQLPESFLGRFQIFYIESALEPAHLQAPQLYLSQISSALSGEIDTKDHSLITLPVQDIRNRNGLTATELN
jgi:hypothetical protein